MLYKIYEESSNIEYNLKIEDIINLIKLNSNKIYYKYIYNKKLKINNDIVIKTQFICHRINNISELKKIDKQFGIEIDLRDDHISNKIILSHDPYISGEYFEDYIKKYNNNTLILNIKSERIETDCVEILKKYNIENYFFLDSSFPMIYYLNKNYNNNKIACRFSEFEPIENFLNIIDFVSFVWIDCFTKFILTNNNYDIIKKNNKKICIVSPELQNKKEKIEEYRDIIIKENIIPDMICCKVYNIIEWI